ncbi:MAG: hypothetical protein ABR880_04650 [Candidatus Sulfotelmatobacter sp.]|jgi:hypothetical protein
MKKQYLHLSVYPCDTCSGPVVAGSTAARENEISKETDIRQVGAICLSCGHRQDKATEPARASHMLPIAWEPVEAISARSLKGAFVEALNRVELR